MNASSPCQARQGQEASMGSKHSWLQKGYQSDLIMSLALVKFTVSNVTLGGALHFTWA